MSKLRPLLSRTLFALGAAAWIGLLAYAWVRNVDWSTRPGESRPAPRAWPVSSALARSRSSDTLVVFVHPHCPCTSATLSELERIAALCGSRLEVQICFSLPEGAEEGWEQGPLWNRARALPGARVHQDVDAIEAARFGAATSGVAFLFDRDGALLFEGGITSSRGHEGDSEGKSAVLDWVLRESSSSRSAPVFGCPIETPATEKSFDRPLEQSP
jgi:hypothetical protein